MALVSRVRNPSRSFSLDVFRGITIAGMILVTSPGGPRSYAPLEHAAWNGWTPTDLIFPSFAFIIGVALTFSLSGRRARGEWRGLSLFDWITPILIGIQFISKLATQTEGFRRSADPPLGGYDLFFVVLFILSILLPQLERRATKAGGSLTIHVMHHGLLMFALAFAWSFDPGNPAGFRTMGVLQRLGIIYLFTGLIVLHTRRRVQLVIAAGLLVLYWVLMKEVPVPGFGAGVLTMEGNLAGYIDRLIIGPLHMYTRPAPYWDPEGLLGSIPAVATGLLGALAGGWMKEERPIAVKLQRMLGAGVLFILAGLVLDQWFPINKNLWSPPYVLFVGGIDVLLLTACIWFVDVNETRKGLGPLIALGSNSILIYLLAGTFTHYIGQIPGGTVNGVGINAREAIYHCCFASWLTPYNASLAMALLYVGVWTLIAMWLYRKSIFVKL